MVSGSPIIASFARAARLRAERQNEATPQRPMETNEEQVSEAVSNSTNPNDLSNNSHILPIRGAHRLHHVLPIATRAAIVSWMRSLVDENGDKNLASKTVRQFPNFFKGSPNANLMRAKRLWADRDKYPRRAPGEPSPGPSTSLTRVSKVGLQRCRLKARSGRGRKRALWVEALHADLREEFDRLRKLGVKFNLTTLRYLALHILTNSSNDAYSMNMVDPRSEQPLHLKIDLRWIQSFTERFRIVSRAHTGKHRSSPQKEKEIEISVAVHLGTVSGLMTACKLDENDIENADETHFIINVDNGRTLGFCGDKEVKYADVVSGGEGFTMVVRISGGRDSRVEAPFLVFKNKDRNYPIRGLPDDVDGVSYRTGPKGWMDRIVMPQWLSESRVIRPLSNNRRRTLYVDNCSGHTYTTDLASASEAIRTDIKYFPPNATHLVQPCDSFVIQKIKRAWSTHWENYKMQMIQKGMWRDSSGKLRNPGKRFFLELSARCVREVNMQRDADGLRYGRKAMIMTGLALNTNGQWEIGQLTPELQRIVRKHQTVFDAARSEAMKD